MSYMEESSVEKADSDTLREIHCMVEMVRYDKEVSLEYMKAYEHDIMIQERGEAIGEARGRREGKREGKREGEISVIRKLSKSMELENIAELLELDVQYVKQIMTFLMEYPEESDEKIASRIIAEDLDKS